MYICTAKQGSDGGIGRHAGLKILWPVMAVRVRFPLRVLQKFAFYEADFFVLVHVTRSVGGGVAELSALVECAELLRNFGISFEKYLLKPAATVRFPLRVLNKKEFAFANSFFIFDVTCSCAFGGGWSCVPY